MPFRLNGPRTPLDSQAECALRRALERARREVPGAEHMRLHVWPNGAGGLLFCLAQDAARARERCRELCRAALAGGPALRGWTAQVGGVIGGTG